MSTSWDLWCLDCEERHGFDGVQGMNADKMMIDLVKLAPSIVAFAPTMEALGQIGGYRSETMLHLNYDRDIIRFKWFVKHAGHRLVARDEYGRISDECGARFKCGTCEHQQHCRRSIGHEPPHGHKRDSA